MENQVEVVKEKKKEQKKTELVRTEGNSPAEMIRMAVAGGADLEKLSKLLDLQERWEANEARKAYHASMAEFKATPLKIEKDKKVGYKTDKGNVGYSHASLANVVEKITIALSKHGLSASWRTAQNGVISVTCKITHVLGHSEETTLSASADTTGSKNSIQAIGSTISYLERYTILAALGLATADMDNDGAKAEESKITENQVATIKEHLMAKEVDEKAFLKYMKCDSLDQIMVSQFNQAITAIKNAKGGQK